MINYTETTDLLDYEPAPRALPLIECSPWVLSIINEKLPELKYMARFATTSEIENLGEVDAILLGTEKFTSQEVSERPHLKAISRIGTGTDNLFLTPEEWKMVVLEGIITPSAVVDYDIELLKSFNLIRDKKAVGGSLNAGIIGGSGRIGSELRQTLRHSFNGINVRTNDTVEPYSDYLLEEVVSWSDVLFVHIPYTKENSGFINGKLLMNLNDKAKVIAPVRSGVFDWNSLRNWSLLKSIDSKVIIVADCETPKDLKFVRSTHHTATHRGTWFERMVKAAVANAVVHLGR